MEQRPSATEMLAILDDVVAQLNRPLTTDLRAEGWSEPAQEDALQYLKSLRARLRRGERLDERDAKTNLSRQLDHYGVRRGQLLERMAELSTLMRESVHGPPPKRPLLQRLRTRRWERRQLAILKRIVDTTRRDS